MSAPAKTERAWRVSTPDNARVCARGAEPGRAYCGRKHKSPEKFTGKNRPMHCADCEAALRADGKLKEGTR